MTTVTPVTSVTTLKVKEMKKEEEQTALELLQRVYRDPMVALPTRMRAAIEAMPFETLRISAVAVGYYTGNDFATRLDRAIEASNRAKLIEGRVIDQAQD